MALAPEEKISYKEGGAAALANFEAGAAGFEARAFRGCGVVTSDPFEVSDDQESIQMLQRYSQVGEFYVMSAPAIPPKPNQKGFMDIMVYDEESDRHVKITYRQAIEATGLFTAGADGTLTDVAPNGSYGRKPDGSEKVIGDVNMEGGQTLDAWKGKVPTLLRAKSRSSAILRRTPPSSSRAPSSSTRCSRPCSPSRARTRAPRSSVPRTCRSRYAYAL
jgi:hypothetical protein